MSRLFQSPSPAKLSAKLLLILAAVFLFSLLLIARSGGLHAQTPDPGQETTTQETTSQEATSLEPAFSESEAQGIDRSIMCPVCPAETIDQAQVQIALQMRQIVREMLAQGSDRGEILDFFVERYGQDILAAPPKSGANLVAWLLPVAGVLAGLIGVFFIIRSMTRRVPVSAAVQPLEDVGLIPYLQLVDRHLAMTRGGPQAGGTSNQHGSAVESPGTGAPELSGPSGHTQTTGPEESR